MASIGGPLALFLTRTNFSVSSAVGFLALFGVSVETGVIMIEFINQLRARRINIEATGNERIVEAAVEGSVQRLRPVMMTMLVATLGLLPAALSHAIGSDSQRPFAIVIVGGLIANLIIGVFLMPASMCGWRAKTTICRTWISPSIHNLDMRSRERPLVESAGNGPSSYLE